MYNNYIKKYVSIYICFSSLAYLFSVYVYRKNNKKNN